MKAFLRTCASIETSIEKVYRFFAQSTLDNPQLKALWLELAQDEHAHAQQLNLAERMLKPDMIHNKDTLPLKQAEKMLTQVQNFLAKAQEAPTMTDLDRLKVSIRLEKDFMAIHLDNALQVADPTLRNMFSALARGDEDHFDALRKYLKQHDELFEV